MKTLNNKLKNNMLINNDILQNNIFNKKNKILLTALFINIFLVLSPFSNNNYLNAQENSSNNENNEQNIGTQGRIPLFYWGLYGGYNLNIHFADFKTLDIVNYPSCCPGYGTQTGGGFNFGLLFEYPIYSKSKPMPANRIAPMTVGLRIGYSAIDGSFKKDSIIGNVASMEGRTVDGTVDFILDSDIKLITFMPYFSMNLFNNFIANLGLNLGFMTNYNFDVREELTNPQNAVFLIEQSRVRNKFDDNEIPDVNKFQAGLSLGIGYELPIAKFSFLIPEIRYNFNLTKVTSAENVNWRASSLQFGLAAKFPILTGEEVKPEIFYQRDTTIEHKLGISEPQIVLNNSSKRVEKIDTIITENYIKYLPEIAELTASLNYYSLEKGNKLDVPIVTIEEFDSQESFPILPIVYFKDGNADLNNTKMNLLSSNATNSFSEQNLKNDIFDIYQNSLNILSKRLKENPKARIIIAGYSSDFGKDKEDNLIWQKRADAVKNYFVNVWKIDEKQIKMEKRDAEKRETTSKSFNDVVEENQKVQIFTNDLALLKPITLSEIEKIANPPQIIFDLTANSKNGLENYNLTFTQGNNTFRSFSNSLNTNNLEEQIIWEVAEEPIPVLEQEVVVKFAVKDKQNQSKLVSEQIEIQQKTIKHKRELIIDDSRIDRYSLVLFDIDKADITPLQKEILNEIKKAIKPNSKLYISGYADRTGETQYNTNLAKRRCDAVNAFLNPNNKNEVEIDAAGNTKLIYDNNIPEGRALSRTVKVEIRTPIK